MLDHLVYAAANLDTAVADLAERLGVRAAPGGKHLGLGTHNALLSLGDSAYLEIIAPDPEQPPSGRPLPFGLDNPTQPRLATWAAKAPDIDERTEDARAAGYDPGPVVPLSRDLPDGKRLEWRLTLRAQPAVDGLVPFLIDWGATSHPSNSAPKGCSFISLRGEHPQPQAVRPLLEALQVQLIIDKGSAPALIATIQTPTGQVELR